MSSFLPKLFQWIEKYSILSNSSYEASVTLTLKPDKANEWMQYYKSIPTINICAKRINWNQQHIINIIHDEVGFFQEYNISLTFAMQSLKFTTQNKDKYHDDLNRCNKSIWYNSRLLIDKWGKRNVYRIRNRMKLPSFQRLSIKTLEQFPDLMAKCQKPFLWGIRQPYNIELEVLAKAIIKEKNIFKGI